MADDLLLKDASGNDLLMRDAAKFCDGSYSGYFSGTTSREWRRAQEREKRRAEGQTRAKKAMKKKAVR